MSRRIRTSTSHGDTSRMVGRGEGRSGVLLLPAVYPVDITGDPHVVVVTVLVDKVAGIDVAGISEVGGG